MNVNLNSLLIYALIGVGAACLLLYKNKSTSVVADPLAEAEVYLAYGRKNQAIEILEKALQLDPSRTDISAKLDELKR